MVAFSCVATGSLLAAGAVAQSCDCTPEVTYIVVEMPPQTSTSISMSPPPTTTITTAPVEVLGLELPKTTATATATTVCTLAPVVSPGFDTSDPTNLIPTGNVTLFYTQASSNTSSASLPGSVNVLLSLNNTGVALENIDAVSRVECFDDLLVVLFNDSSSFDSALHAWQQEEQAGLVMITNHLGNCDAEFERGFFVVEGIASNSENNTVLLSSSRQEIANISKAMEMTFGSLPAAGLTRRLTLDPSVSIPFSVSIPEDTVIYSDSPYVTVIANDASFSSNVTFSGYLNYDFWGFKLKALYFDLDTSFTAGLGISAGVGGAYSKSISYSPGDLAYYVVDVPGVVQIGPALDFGVGLDLGVSGAVNVTAGITVALADGNVHLDVLDSANNKASGWTPTYNPTVNISEAAEVTANASASVTVEIAFTLLGGLLDLSSGLTAVPSFNNVFTLESTQDVSLANVTVSQDGSGSSCPDGVHLRSDFDFTLTGFATKYWSTQLYSVDVPLVDKCWDFS